MMEYIHIAYAALLPITMLLIVAIGKLVRDYFILTFIDECKVNVWVATAIHPLLGIGLMYKDKELNDEPLKVLDSSSCIGTLHYGILLSVAIYFKVPVLTTPIIWLLAVPFVAHFIISRVWAFRVVYNFKKQEIEFAGLYDEIASKQAVLGKLDEQMNELKQQLIDKVTEANNFVNRLTVKQTRLQHLDEYIEYEKNDIESIVQKVAANLRVVEQLPPNAKIAIDTNVLMEWDTYLLQALRSQSLVISKRVQRELDKNKSKADEYISYKARRGIRSLLKLDAEDYTLLCGNWERKEMETKGIATDWEDERIIADYYSYQQQGHTVYIASDDANFIITAKPHFPLLHIPYPKIFND